MKTLKIKDIKKYYGKNDNLVKAVDGISIDIESSKFTAVIGASGSGKSTLLHCIAGLDRPTSGNVFLDDIDIYTLSDVYLSRIRREEFGFIFQSFNLIPVLNVYDNIILPVSLDGKKPDEEYINRIIEKVGLESQLKKFPNELSGGQQQRVAIARALSNKPSVIFADEPTGNLDSKTTLEVMDLLKSTVRDFNKTLVMITHNNDIANEADRVITICDGKVVDDVKK
ncbi:ABC transporter ATP-binding protein [Peptostreptococcus sp. MV1]|uniref:ABC transporter ATP-binding protein n=1 Tax=Peptostreptococcus sp. MV1 TaxID=1219626 RepID=UPI00050F0452|nr:ABC transporter ATP-binding protein [Peptostreptococcus sp. MV1]KGF15622.1 ABC transporter ATP-binding protein [Peptostreptococcus sp. MV1]